MIVVINAGGSGTRLWPLSTPDFPKHLLKVTGENSLLQLAYQRAKKLTDDIYIVTEAGHAQHVKEQLPELGEDNFIIEPARRNTTACIVAGLHHVAQRHSEDEPIAFLHADHIINDTEGFSYSFNLAAQAAAEHNKITLVGVEPVKPSSAFGYIQKDVKIEDGGLLYSVKGFKEKPDLELAQEYVASGRYLWNCGYFVGSVKTFKNAFKNFAAEWLKNLELLLQTKSEDEYKTTYLSFESIAIDYALMEKDKELLVVPASFDWVDVGSFSDVYRIVKTDTKGNHHNGGKAAFVDVENTMVINHETDKPVGIVGLDNVVVVNTKEGLLIIRKDLDQKVKDIVNQLKD